METSKLSTMDITPVEDHPLLPTIFPEKKENSEEDDLSPIHATHPAVVAVCNVLMHDSPTEFQTWHCPAEHVRTRDTMEQCISHLILQRRPTANLEWIEKLPEVSKKIERNLYFSARSIDEYSDPYTLVNRIQGMVKTLIATAATQPPPTVSPPPTEQHNVTQLNANNSNNQGQGQGSDGENGHGENDEDDMQDSDNDTASRLKDQPEGTLAAGITQLGHASKADLLQAPLYLVPLKEAEIVQQQVAAAASSLGQPMFLPSRQVSSQGCSRVFIIKVLISVSEFVKGKSLPSIFTFKRELVMDWLISAKQACCLPTYMAEEGYYGGPPFVDPDPSTHWSEPHQLYTWWKNNVERRSKFKVLQEDARYKGLDPRRLQRARWCEAVVALSEVIRASSGSTNASRTGPGIPGLPAGVGGPMGALSGIAGLTSGLAGLAQMGHPSAYIQALTASANSNNATHLLYGYTNGVTEDTGSSGSNGATSGPLDSTNGATDDVARKGVDALISAIGSGSSGSAGLPSPTGGTASSSAPSVFTDASAFLSAYNAVAGATNTITTSAAAAPSSSERPEDKAPGTAATILETVSMDTPQTSAAPHLLPYLPQQHLNPQGPAAAPVKSEFPGMAPSSLSQSSATSASSQPHTAESYRSDIFPLTSSSSNMLPASMGGLSSSLGSSLGAGLNGSLNGGIGGGISGGMETSNPRNLNRDDTPQSYMMANKYPVPLMTTMIPGTNIPYRNYSNTFPVKLFDLVSSEDEAVVGWQGHGTSFQVRDMEKFVNIVLPKHFKHNNFTSFQRQLNLYGFRRSASYDKGAYYHPQFQQGQRELAESIRRVLAPSSGGNASSHGHQMHQQDLAAAYGGMGYGGMGLQMHPLMSYMGAMGGLPQGMNMGMPMMNIQGMQGMMHMPMAMQGYPGAGASSDPGGDLDPAAQRLLGLSQVSSSSSQDATGSAGSAPGAGTAGTPAPLPLPQWIQPQSYYSNMMGGGAQGANYWQGLALNGGIPNMPGNIPGNMGKMNPYMMAQNPYMSQFPFQAYPGMEGAQGMPGGDGMGAYNYNGTYNIMSQLARSFHPVTGKPIVPPRGYNRNSKRHRDRSGSGELDAQGNRRAKLSARDRKLLDMHTVGEGFNAEQFLAGTALSDRYNLANKSSLLGAARHRRKKGSAADGEDGADAQRGRGRPKGSGRREDEASYQDGDEGDELGAGARRKHRYRKKSKHHGEDSDSSGSEGAPAKSRRSGGSSRNSSYKNLPADVLAKSGLSRNSAITHLTENADEDLIDLRNPQKRRIYLDFTINDAKEEGDAAAAEAEADNDYVCGFYRGALTQGKRDVGLHCLLHGSRTLAEALLRIANDSPGPQTAASMIAAQSKDNAPRCTRIGEDFQCDIPALLPPPNPSATNTVTRRTAAITSIEGLVWRPNVLSTECVDSFVELLKARKKLIPLPVGAVLVVHLAAENAYRLCCVLDVLAVPVAGEGSAVDSSALDTSVRVFDGYENWVVPAAHCMNFKEGEMEQALQILVKHQGQLTPALVEEVDWLLRSEVVGAAASAVWTSEEVQTFCHAVKRYGDNIRKVWELRFQDTKKLAEVQEFFLCIYPHTQLGGAKRVVNVYYRGELAAAGFPDGDPSGSDAEQGDEASVSNSTTSGSSSGASSSDDDEDLESEAEAPQDPRSAARDRRRDSQGRQDASSTDADAAHDAVNVSAPIVAAKGCTGKETAVQGSRRSVEAAPATAAAPNSASSRAAAKTSAPAAPPAPVAAPAPVPAAVDASRSSRKRASLPAAKEDAPAPASAEVATASAQPAAGRSRSAPAPAVVPEPEKGADSAAKKRRR